MPALKSFCASLWFLVMLLTGSLVAAQDSETITVSSLYSDNNAPPGFSEYEEILTPCKSDEVWDVAPSGAAFTALAQAYACAETGGQLTKYGALFVELRGRCTAYEGESHSDGIFEITELVRHSTAAVDITACGSECEDIYGANSPACLAQVDGQCGSTRNRCISGDYFDHEEGSAVDTATQYRSLCLGSYGGESAYCTTPKTGLQGSVEDLSHLHSGPLTLYGRAYHTATPTTSIPIEIYVGSAHGTGTLAVALTADQPRPAINTVQGLTGDYDLR